MQKQTIQFVRGLVILPFLTTGSPLAMLQNAAVSTHQQMVGKSIFALTSNNDASQAADIQAEALRKEHAAKIDAYYGKYDLPLAGFGVKLVLEAEKYDLDWRLLPAIAMRESTAGKFACYNNPFGWGSCKIKFDTWEDAIETVARNLGGENPSTEKYYKGKTTEEKLAHYNSVIPSYTPEIMHIMDLIDATEVANQATPEA